MTTELFDARLDPVDDRLRQRTRRADAQQIRNLRAHRDRDLVEQRDPRAFGHVGGLDLGPRSEEHTSELQSPMRISYAVFCLKKKNTSHKKTTKSKKKTQNVQTRQTHTILTRYMTTRSAKGD